MIHSLILSDRRNNQYKTLGILIFIIYPILSFPFILKGILKRERWAYLLGAILMGYIGMLYPPAGDMYRYAEDFNLYKELDWEYFWIFMALKFDYFLPLLSWILGKLGAYPESTRFLFVACSYYLLLDLYHDITLSNKDMTRRTRVYSRHYKIFCVNGNTGFRNESRIFYFIHLQNEEAYERKESSSA